MFGGIGGLEIVVIMAVALLVLGPDHLPQVMRSIGKTLGEFRRASTELQRSMNTEIAQLEKTASLSDSGQYAPAGPEQQALPPAVTDAAAGTPKRRVRAVRSPRLKAASRPQTPPAPPVQATAAPSCDAPARVMPPRPRQMSRQAPRQTQTPRKNIRRSASSRTIATAQHPSPEHSGR